MLFDVRARVAGDHAEGIDVVAVAVRRLHGRGVLIDDPQPEPMKNWGRVGQVDLVELMQLDSRDTGSEVIRPEGSLHDDALRRTDPLDRLHVVRCLRSIGEGSVFLRECARVQRHDVVDIGPG